MVSFATMIWEWNGNFRIFRNVGEIDGENIWVYKVRIDWKDKGKRLFIKMATRVTKFLSYFKLPDPLEQFKSKPFPFKLRHRFPYHKINDQNPISK